MGRLREMTLDGIRILPRATVDDIRYGRLDENTLREIEEARKKIAEQFRPLIEAARESSRLTAKDYGLTINY